MQSSRHKYGLYRDPPFQALTYRQALRYFASLVNYEKRPAFSYRRSLKLQSALGFFAFCGNPQREFPSVHVAGTKGKGSVCSFIASILTCAGYTTGLYTSPHLHDLRERVRVMSPLSRRRSRGEFDGLIPPRSFASLAGDLRTTTRRYLRTPRAHGQPTFFEAITALAFLYFRKRRVDCAVIETGMGGRLDATNTMRPLVCVITPISLDHVGILGTTVRQIAREKAGIIKGPRGPVVVCSDQTPDALAVLRARAARTGSRFIHAGRITRINSRTRSFSVVTGTRTYHGLKVALLGRHQLSNAATAVAAAEQLRLLGFSITRESVRRGLRDARWPARCEVTHRRPLTVIDGCQNRASALALRAAIVEYFRYRRLILVFGMSADKDLVGTGSALAPIADEVILTKAANPRACDPAVLAPFFKGATLRFSSRVDQAKKMARMSAGPRDMILVCGSLFVAGEYKYGRAQTF